MEYTYTQVKRNNWKWEKSFLYLASNTRRNSEVSEVIILVAFILGEMSASRLVVKFL